MRFEVGKATQRRPPGSGDLLLKLILDEIVMWERGQSEMPNVDYFGYPVLWAALGEDWIKVWPLPSQPFEYGFSEE